MLTPALWAGTRLSKAEHGKEGDVLLKFVASWSSSEWLTPSPRILEGPSSPGWSVPSASIPYPFLCSSGEEDPPCISPGVKFRSFYFFFLIISRVVGKRKPGLQIKN